MEDRIVITGMGVVAPNAIGLDAFNEAIIQGKSGIQFYPELQVLKFRCQVGGIPPLNNDFKETFEKKHSLIKLKSSEILYGVMAAVEAWENAGLPVPDPDQPDWRSGCIFGTGSNGVEASHYGIQVFDKKQGAINGDGASPQQAFNSGVSSYISGVLGLGNQVTSNASACNTGTEAILLAANRIKHGLADRMVVGSSESNSPYVWGPFDSMFATAQGYNATPEQASKPLSKHAAGFVPSSGSGALVVEGLTSALNRGARIYGEVLGGQINSGGHRGDGTMTIGNIAGMVRCIQDSLKIAKVKPEDIDLISGHLSSTIGDIKEIQSWATALNLQGTDFPYINAMKSMIGHCLSASGSIESIASVLQLYHGYIHPSLNSEELHPEIAALIDHSKVPQTTIKDIDLQIVAKISLGFGDVNSCVIFKRWDS